MQDVAEGETQSQAEVETVEAGTGENQSADSAVNAETAKDETDAKESKDKEADEAEAEDEVVISIGEEPPPPKDEPAPAWVKELRKSHQELKRKNRELEARLQATGQMAQPAPVVVGKKPTLEDSDYDAEKFEKALSEWFDRKRKADEAEAKARAQQESQAQEWKGKLEGYAKKKAELKVSDFDEAESLVTESFNVTQQGILLQGAENPHYVVYALGKSPKKAKELAAIKDPIQFAFAVAKLEAQLKVTSRKPAAAPEKTISGTGRVSGAVDSTLEKLRAEAEKTGNYSKVIAYKRSKKNT